MLLLGRTLIVLFAISLCNFAVAGKGDEVESFTRADIEKIQELSALVRSQPNLPGNLDPILVTLLAKAQAGIDAKHELQKAPANIEDFEKIVTEHLVKTNSNYKDYQSLLESTAQNTLPAYAKAYGLTEYERISVYIYCYSFYRWINDALRDVQGDTEKLSPEEKLYFQVLTSALHKLPDFEGQVKRETRKFESDFSTYSTNDFYSDPAFLSSTYRLDSGWYGGVKLNIWCRHGKRVDLLSGEGLKEAEVIFLPGTKFRVKDTLGDIPQGGTSLALHKVNFTLVLDEE